MDPISLTTSRETQMSFGICNVYYLSRLLRAQ